MNNKSFDGDDDDDDDNDDDQTWFKLLVRYLRSNNIFIYTFKLR